MAGAVRRVLWVLSALWASSFAHAQDHVLHEYVPDVSDDELGLLLRGDTGDPTGIVYQGEFLPPPDDGALAGDERAMSALPGDGRESEEPGRRSPTFRPDRITDLEGSIGYYTVFNPSIAPFKRVTALDTVALDTDGTPVLRVSSERARALPVEGAVAPLPDSRPRDRFWGSVVLDFSNGSRVPLPSVSPESRILSLRTEPTTAIRIERDRADNFFAVLRGRGAGQVRVVFLTDAPRGYFNAPIPDGPSDALAAEANVLPPTLQQDALRFAREIGLHRGMPLATVLARLTGHFRSFEEDAEPPDDHGNIYLDLARGKKGVCRHRAYGFVITALALGIPARFVMNEAHAWAEIKMPVVGYMRIDLGGAAQGLTQHGARDRPIYRPTHPDPLPRPEAYQRAYAEARAAASASSEGGAPAGSAEGQGDRRAAVEGAGFGPPVEGQGPEAEGREPGVPADGPDAEPRAAIAIHLDGSAFEVFRGRSLDLSGRVVLAEPGSALPGSEVPAGLRIEVLVSGPRERLLGVTVSRSGGLFRGTFGIPPDVAVGTYRLVVRTPGNRHFAAAVAR